MVEPIACIAAMATNKPVKYVYGREEEMQVSSPRAAERIYIKDGVMADGTIVARKVTLYVDAGAYSRHSPYGTTKAAAHMPGPYDDPERVGRRPLRLHEPHAVERDARLRRDDRRLRAGVPDGPDRAGAGDRPAAAAAQERLPRRRHEGAPQARGGHGADRGDPAGGRARRPRPAGRVPGDVVDGGAADGQAARARLRRGQLPDGHEPGRRPVPGADPLDDDGHASSSRSPRSTSARASRRSPRSARPRRSGCRSRTSSSTPPTPTPARTAWARSPAAARTASATR